MSLWTLSSLLVRKSKAEIYQLGLDAAEAVGLTTTSWETGDPTRSLYHYLAAALDAVEDVVVSYISGAALELAAERARETGDTTWLEIAAYQLSGYEPREATYAETACTLTNAGGGVYVIEPGDITAKNSGTGKTYHNLDGGTLTALGTLSLTFIADESGSDSNAGATEIDELVTKLLGVTISNPAAAVGGDKESADSIVTGAREKLGALSANGPRDAYNYVAKNSELTGISTVTRSRSFGDSDTGDVALYIAGAGALSGGDVTAVEAAIAKWSTPLCITPTVQSASEVNVPVTYEIWLYESVNKTQTEVEDAIEDALQTLFATRPIGGDIIPPATTGKLYASLVLSEIRNVFPAHVFRVVLTAPAADVSLAIDEVAVLGTLTPTVNFIDTP
jgi:hypothetical protein